MIILMPKEIKDKIKYSHNDVVVREGVKLTPEEQKIYEAFRIEFKEALERKFK